VKVSGIRLMRMKLLPCSPDQQGTFCQGLHQGEVLHATLDWLVAS